MTQEDDNTPRRQHPLRGLIIGLALSMILFPYVQHLVFSAIGVTIGLVAGIVLGATLLSMSSVRR